MRKLVVIGHQDYVRNLVAAGAFDDLEDGETWYVSRPLEDTEALAARPGWLGEIGETGERREAYGEVRRLIHAALRFRSRTARIKLNVQSPKRRRRTKLRALPGVRHVILRRLFRRFPPNPELMSLAREVRPELIVAPSGGTDALVIDAVRVGRELGVPTLVVIYNWDNLSSKSAFPVKPDYLGVVGRQSVDHAWRIHRIRPERVGLLGGPYIDHYFRHEAGSTESPFPFRYVLFAGCYLPFDELSALERLEAEIEQRGLDLKVVYRPHPNRRDRRTPDFVDESRFKHVVIDPQVRDAYLARFSEREGKGGVGRLPPLDYYPALLENAEFVVCPLSTMIIESAIFERRVLVIAYHDGQHRSSPGVAVDYLHFEGVDEIDGFEVVRDIDELAPVFSEMAAGERVPASSLRAQVDRWIHWDERSYSRRLADWVDEIGRREDSGEQQQVRDAAPLT
jgi:hypothetical protein